MKLINCKNYSLEEFWEDRVPKYAILSHRWEDDELTYQDMLILERAQRRKGFGKIRLACELALKARYDYVWVDTCCIDKSSSAELTEAINSMFEWYSKAAICYAYLSDYSLSDPTSGLHESQWFTRGWTLQELIAPPEVEFYDQAGQLFGTRDSLRPGISAITGIEEEVLTSNPSRNLESLLRSIPVARRMSWASRRRTTRKEDIAYCLLGIFSVNMPMLYGEGMRAFTRLQEEIMKDSNDLTLFIWQGCASSPDDPNVTEYRGILAHDPSEFARAAEFEPMADLKFNPEFSMSNKGVRIQTSLHRAHSDRVMLPLNCHPVSNPAQTVGIFLKHQGGGVYARADPYSPLAVVDTNGAASPAVSIHIAKHVSEHAVEKMRTIHRSAIHFQFHLGVFEKVATMPRDLWDAESNLFIPSGTPTTAAFHHFRAIQPFSGEFVVAFGTNAGDEHPWICIADNVSPLFSAAMAGDLRQVGEIGRQSDRTKIKIWALSLTSSHPSERVKVEIALRNSTLWKQPVYRADVVEASKFVAGCRIM
ncbi:putative HET domain-containing protein [Seiridium unicorne]|uniref:HET domain-containing protein n=1 Tax=Seiridium unicorne TaxID=138068 RepID=A0ABR2UH85_9PEZI